MINEEDFDSNRPDELREPKAIVEREGFQAVVASTMAVTAKGMFGIQVNPDTALEGVCSEEFNAVVVVGR